MSSFIACAKTTAVTILSGYVAIKGLAIFWALAMLNDDTVLITDSMRWMSFVATVFVGVVAGLVGAYYDRAHPVINAVIAALLAELLNLSIGAGLRDDPVVRTVAHTAAAAVLAGLIAAWRSRRAISTPAPETKPAPQPD
jgi:hypothetical protein